MNGSCFHNLVYSIRKLHMTNVWSSLELDFVYENGIVSSSKVWAHTYYTSTVGSIQSLNGKHDATDEIEHTYNYPAYQSFSNSIQRLEPFESVGYHIQYSIRHNQPTPNQSHEDQPSTQRPNNPIGYPTFSTPKYVCTRTHTPFAIEDPSYHSIHVGRIPINTERLTTNINVVGPSSVAIVAPAVVVVITYVWVCHQDNRRRQRRRRTQFCYN